jgi:hypothetical protein
MYFDQPHLYSLKRSLLETVSKRFKKESSTGIYWEIQVILAEPCF